jgi:hypothetical protein
MDGMIVLHGTGVRRAASLERAKITDIAPTILWAMGLPVPRYMDGEVLEAAFEPEAVAAHPVEFSYDSPSVNLADMDEGAFSAEEEDLVIDRLRDLGYIA